MRAIDFHVHPPVTEWLDGSMAGYVEPAEAYFRSSVQPMTFDQIAAVYGELDILGVLLAWDAETATQRPPLSNDLIAAECATHPDTFVGFGSVDPLKGDRAVEELDHIAELRLKGVKLHPSLQAFAPDNELFWPIYSRCRDLGLIALFHTGTSGIGARMPGGQGIRIDLAHPLRLDPIAAAFPDLQIIAAHFGYPWHADLIAMALHKTNVWIDISGWAPRYIPPEIVREMRGRLQDQFLFGSDFPFIQPQRCIDELEALDLPASVVEKILIGNGTRLLGRS